MGAILYYTASSFALQSQHICQLR